MKKITLLFILTLTFATWSYGQCTNPVYQFPTTTVSIAAIPGPQTIAANNWAQNEFSVIDGLVIGESYTVTTDIMTYITVTTDGTTVIDHGFDSISFVATTTGITVYWTLDAACANGPNTNILTQIECTTCTCTATAVPAAATVPTPADMAIDIPIDFSGATPLITPFSWTEPTINAPDSYNLSLGTNAAADDIGVISSATNGNGITFGGWTPGTTYFWKLISVNCFGTTESAIWSFTTENCTSTAAPNVASTPAPIDMGMDIPIDDTDPANLLITPFSWVDAPLGDPATSYNLTLGTNAAGDDIGTITGATNGNGINFTWAYNTTYFWKVDAVNCFGTTTGTVWSFTTEMDPSLSTESFNTQLFSVYPNPAKDVISIKTDAIISTVEIYNQLGQRVNQVNADALIDKTININNLNNGIYFMKINAEGKQQTIKFIKE